MKKKEGINMTKKIICVLLSVIVGLTFLSGSITAFAKDNLIVSELEIQNPDEIIEDIKMFTNLFFTNSSDINKIIDYFDFSKSSTEVLSSISKTDILDLITELELDTNYEETICIIENVFYAADYAESGQAHKDIEASAFLNGFGGTAQPNWGSSVHKDYTTALAKKYFNDDVANKIGTANRNVDIIYSYSSSVGYVFKLKQQYIHFNAYTEAGEDSRDYYAATWSVLSRLSWKNGDKNDAYMYLGYALHAVQDKESHGNIGAGEDRPQHLKSYTAGDNITHADDETGWEWTNAKRNALKSVPGSRVRYSAAVTNTDDILKEFKDVFK